MEKLHKGHTFWFALARNILPIYYIRIWQKAKQWANFLFALNGMYIQSYFMVFLKRIHPHWTFQRSTILLLYIYKGNTDTFLSHILFSVDCFCFDIPWCHWSHLHNKKLNLRFTVTWLCSFLLNKRILVVARKMFTFINLIKMQNIEAKYIKFSKDSSSTELRYTYIKYK